jgi:hypothetical protein
MTFAKIWHIKNVSKKIIHCSKNFLSLTKLPSFGVKKSYRGKRKQEEEEEENGGKSKHSGRRRHNKNSWRLWGEGAEENHYEGDIFVPS